MGGASDLCLEVCEVLKGESYPWKTSDLVLGDLERDVSLDWASIFSSEQWGSKSLPGFLPEKYDDSKKYL